MDVTWQASSVGPYGLVLKDPTHRTDEGLFLSKLEYFRVIFLVCKVVNPACDMDVRQMTLEYSRDCGYGQCTLMHL